MHNCKATQAALLDLVFDEMDLDQRAALMDEANRCATCRAEYASLSSTLITVNRSIESNRPPEEFWLAYQNRMSQRLDQSLRRDREIPMQSSREGFFGKLWQLARLSVRVPAPVAAAFLLMFGFSILLVARSGNSIIEVPVVERVVETRDIKVPVIEERVVTRVVYVDRARTGRMPTRTTRTPGPRGESEAAGNPASSLAGFRPMDQVKLTLIKGSSANEK